MTQTAEHRQMKTALGTLMAEQERGPEWVAKKLRAAGLSVDRSVVYRWSVGERRIPDYALKPLAEVFRVAQKAIRP